ncbi:MAG TPA: DUF1761 domain-containing protein [Candidatus Paceibacterota bacterium]|nr:DUF1761 domain-containing protein [Candidatus Paceibacterota bacterium]
MSINYLAVALAAIAQFIIGAIWYMPLFGKLWGKIHGFDLVAPEQQKEMQKGMWPYLVVQFIATIVTTIVLAIFITYLPADWNVYALAGFFWIGFVVPTQVGAVIFGGTKPEWMVTKTLIMAGGSILCLEAAAIIIKMMM